MSGAQEPIGSTIMRLNYGRAERRQALFMALSYSLFAVGIAVVIVAVRSLVPGVLLLLPCEASCGIAWSYARASRSLQPTMEVSRERIRVFAPGLIRHGAVEVAATGIVRMVPEETTPASRRLDRARGLGPAATICASAQPTNLSIELREPVRVSLTFAATMNGGLLPFRGSARTLRVCAENRDEVLQRARGSGLHIDSPD